MVVENNIEIQEDDSGIGIFVLSSLSSSCLLLVIILILVGGYFYYKRMNINILERFPFLQKLTFLRKIPFFNKWWEENEVPVNLGGKVHLNLQQTSSSKPKALLATSSTTKTFDKNAGNQMILQQASDTCSSAIADGLCGNLVKGDCSLSITTDGNLVLKKGNTTLWDSFTNKDRPNTTYTLNLTNNGNLILLDNNWSIIWSNNLNMKTEDGPYMLILRDDNNLVIENNAKNVVWETGTSGGKVSSILENRANTGYVPTDPSIWQLYKEKSTNLPNSFKIESLLVPTDQYDVSTCVPSQILGILSYNYWLLYNKKYDFSRLFTFYYARVDAGQDPTKNDGSSTQSVYNTIRSRGLLLEKYYEYDGTTAGGESGTKNTCSVQKYQEKPQDELNDIAKKNIPIFNVYRIDQNNDLLTVLKTAIYNGMPVLFGMYAYKSYWSSHTNQTGEISYPDKSTEERLKTGHQVSMWGWDDSKEVFHVLNTKGPNFYNKGWNTIPYKYIQDADLASEFHIIKMDDSTHDIIDDANYINKEDWVFRKDLGCPYVNTVQKGVECFERPPPGYDWTTAGGLTIGKVCPPGSNDSGTTCWYDRGAGRVPDKTPCPDGWRDDGTVCWLDSYGRGAGRDANKGPCDEGQRDDGTSCWEDYKCDGGWDEVNWGALGTSRTWNALKNCHGCGCIKKKLFDRQFCNNDEDKDGVRCYPKCKSGYHPYGCCLCEPDGGIKRIELSTRLHCADDEEMKDGLCYKKCKSGFNPVITVCEFSKDVKWGTKKNNIKNCK